MSSIGGTQKVTKQKKSYLTAFYIHMVSMIFPGTIVSTIIRLEQIQVRAREQYATRKVIILVQSFFLQDPHDYVGSICI